MQACTTPRRRYFWALAACAILMLDLLLSERSAAGPGVLAVVSAAA